MWTQGVSQVSLLEMWQISLVSVCQHTCRHSGSWASSCFYFFVFDIFDKTISDLCWWSGVVLLWSQKISGQELDFHGRQSLPPSGGHLVLQSPAELLGGKFTGFKTGNETIDHLLLVLKTVTSGDLRCLGSSFQLLYIEDLLTKATEPPNLPHAQSWTSQRAKNAPGRHVKSWSSFATVWPRSLDQRYESRMFFFLPMFQEWEFVQHFGRWRHATLCGPRLERRVWTRRDGDLAGWYASRCLMKAMTAVLGFSFGSSCCSEIHNEI